MNTIHSLANGDPLKYEEVFELPVSYAFLNRRIKLQEYHFNKKMNEIMKNKK